MGLSIVFSIAMVRSLTSAILLGISNPAKRSHDVRSGDLGGHTTCYSSSSDARPNHRLGNTFFSVRKNLAVEMDHYKKSTTPSETKEFKNIALLFAGL